MLLSDLSGIGDDGADARQPGVDEVVLASVATRVAGAVVVEADSTEPDDNERLCQGSQRRVAGVVFPSEGWADHDHAPRTPVTWPVKPPEHWSAVSLDPHRDGVIDHGSRVLAGRQGPNTYDPLEMCYRAVLRDDADD